jgi:small subunit ribosomal protein S2
MPSVSMRALLEAGVHFGHQTRRWNPKMRPYIFAERNGIHIIDLAQTVRRLDTALDFVRETVAAGDSVLFVGTKKQAQEPVAEEATRADMPYVNQRWLGGMMTNFVTIRKRLGLLDQLEARQAAGEFERLSKKESGRLTDEMMRLQRMLGGVRRMRRLPGAMFIIDPQRERIAVTEGRKLEIPIIGTGDTNVDPDQLDFVVPANDDAIRAIRLLCSLVADAALEGAQERAARPEPEPAAVVEEQEEASDEMIAALAAGGTFSFEPEPDEEDLLPGELGVDASDIPAAELATAEAAAAEPAAAEPAAAEAAATEAAATEPAATDK